ncbi:MAG: hypothetical protein D6775_16320 [Caldilineae bacterium]|nr:MAG: hypothetical protein D6775_16320 [Caldilineae bacterium]
MKTYPALVLAGYTPAKPDPLALAMGRHRKALLPIAGKPMVYWIVKALRESPRVGTIAIVGIGPEDNIDFGTEVLFVPNQTRHFDNIMTGIRALQEAVPDLDYLLITSADIPLLKAETVDWFVRECEKLGADFLYSIVEKDVMEGQYPGAARSYVPMAEGKFCGGDLFFVRAAVAHNNDQLVRDLLERRKSAFQQVRLAGFRAVVKFLFRRLSIADAEKIARRLVQCDARAIISPYADLGMDVDKPHQLEMVRKLVGAQA